MKVTITMENPSGLHARPAVLLADRASKLEAEIRLYAHGKEAKATDVLEIMEIGRASCRERV